MLQKNHIPVLTSYCADCTQLK